MPRTHSPRHLFTRGRLVPAIVVIVTLLGAASRPADAQPAAPATDGGNSAAVKIVAERLGVDPASLTVVAEAITTFAELDLTVTSAKVMDPAGDVHGVAFDSKGNEVDVDGLAAEALAVRRARFGAVDPALDALLANAPDEPRAVLIWLSEPAASKLPERPEAAGKPLESGEIDRIYADLDAPARRGRRPAGRCGARRRAAFRRTGRRAHADAGDRGHPRRQADQRTGGRRAHRHDLRRPGRDSRPRHRQADHRCHPGARHRPRRHGRARRHRRGGRSHRERLLAHAAGATEHDERVRQPDPAHHERDVGDRRATGQRVRQIVGEDGVSKRCRGARRRELHRRHRRAPSRSHPSRRLGRAHDQPQLGQRHEPRHRRRRSVLRRHGPQPLAHDREVGRQQQLRQRRRTGRTPDADVTSPGLAYNVITVGGLDDAGTAQWSDDTMYACSSFGDPMSQNGDREKPELVAPAANIEMVDPGPANLAVDSGTSFAAPHVTGVTALLMQQNSRLTVWPEITRAMLMASATHNIEGVDEAVRPGRCGWHGGQSGVGHRRQHAGMERRRVQLLDTAHARPHHACAWDGAPTTASRSRGPPTRRSPTTPSGRAPTSICRWSTASAASSPRRELRQHHRDRRVRLVDGRHLHGPGDQLPVRSQYVPRLGVGHVVDAHWSMTSGAER